MVMDVSVRALRWRWRRRRYALLARRRLLRGLPALIGLPGGRLLERQVYVYWRVRLVLWAVLPAAGWLAVGWVGIVPGVAAAILAELVHSYRLVGYRRPGRGRPAASPAPGPGDPGGSAGVREPRRPRPAGGAGAAELPAGPAAPGMG
jgi:hypothetical protein